MRKYLYCFTFIFSLVLVGNSQDQVLEDIGTSLKNGSARELIRFCGNTVIIKMNGSNSSYQKTEAESVLRNFFQTNPPTNFSYIHQGSSSEGLKYCIGKYSVSNGSYRVVLLLKEKATGFQLDTITLTKE